MNKSFIFFAGWSDDIADQPPEIRLEIYEAIVSYGKTGEAPTFTHKESELLFRAIRRDIDRNQEERERFLAKQRANGKLGGRPRKNPKNPSLSVETQENPKNPVVFSKTQKSHNVDVDSDYDLDSDKQPPTPLKGADGEEAPKSERQLTRESAWRVFAAYPKQAGGLTMTALEIYGRDRLHEREAEILESVAAWKASEQWQKEAGRYIPSFTGFIEREIWRLKPPENKKQGYTPKESVEEFLARLEENKRKFPPERKPPSEDDPMLADDYDWSVPENP